MQADILLLQEHWLYKEEFGLFGRIGEGNFAYNAVSPMVSSQCHCHGRPYGGAAVLWQKSLQKLVSVVCKSSDRLSAIALNTESSRILIVSVYLPYDNGSVNQVHEFEEQLAALGTVLVQDPSYSAVAVMSDFNADLRVGFKRRFGQRFQAFLVSNDLSALGLDCHRDDPSFISWTSGDGEKSRWLDYAVVSGCLQVGRFRVIEDVSVVSDHWPNEMFLAVDVLAPRGGSSVPVVGRLDRNRCPNNCIKTFQDDLSSRLGEIAVPTDAICCSSPSLECDHSDTLFDYCNRIVDALKRAARRCIQRKPPPGCRKPGWSKELSEAQKEASAAYQKWKKLGKSRC